MIYTIPGGDLLVPARGEAGKMMGDGWALSLKGTPDHKAWAAHEKPKPLPPKLAGVVLDLYRGSGKGPPTELQTFARSRAE